MARLSRRTVVGALTALPAAVALAPAAAARGQGAGVTPLPRAHAHNDYLHERPLFDALSHGFASVEADIWLVEGELMIAHEFSAIQPGRTLRSLYLDPLAELVRANRGSVYPGHRRMSLQLLIDIKNTGDATYQVLSRQLRDYHTLFSSAVGGRVRTGPVTAVISGERSARMPMEQERARHAFYDGRLDDLNATAPAPASFIPLISSNWTQSFSWRGAGEMPADQRELLHRIIATAHSRGQRVRFWETPEVPGAEREAVWRELLAAEVDHINTDDLAGLESFLRTA